MKHLLIKNTTGLVIFMFFCNTAMAALIEEIIVTAQKREQSAQDIGITISAFDGDDFREFGSDIGSLAGQIPNVEAYGNGTYLQSFFIRGIGLNEFSGNFNAPVAIHLDEVYVSKNWMASRPNFDIQRVEALKGPQGTLFGRNTTGGAVNYYTNLPAENFEAFIEAGIDNHERYNLEAAVSGPLSDNVRGRFSYYGAIGNGGPQDNIFTGEEHGKPDVQMFRGQLIWDASEQTTIRLLAHGGYDKSDLTAYKGPGIFNFGAPGFCPQALAGQVSDAPSTCAKFGGLATAAGVPEAEFEPADPHTINQNYAPTKNDDFYGGYLRIDHELDWATVTSISAYERYNRNQREDSDSTPIASADVDWFNEIDVFTQELRLTGEVNDRWRYVAGFFFEHDNLKQYDSAELFSATPFLLVVVPAPPPRFVGDFEQENDSYAFFLHNEYELSDTLTATVGLRYTNDQTDINARTLLGLNDPTGDDDRVTPVVIVDTLNDSRTDNDFSWKLGLTWDVSDDLLAYASLTTGFRTGGYSVPFGGSIVEYAPEDLFAQEVGMKGLFLNESLQINAAFFRYEYQDLQVNVDDPVSPLVPVTRNIGESETIGFEIDAWWRPSENWDAKFGAGYLDAEFTETNRAMTTISALGPIPLEGNTPVNSPDWQINGLLRYQQPVMQGWDVMLMSDFRWVDQRFLEVTNQPADRADDYWVVNVRAGLLSQDGNWELSVWGKNIFDEEYLTYTNNLPGPGFKLDIFGEQASFGATLRYNFQ